MTLSRLIRINDNLVFTVKKLFKENYIPYNLAVYDIRKDTPKTEAELLDNIEKMASIIKFPEFAYLKNIGKNVKTK